MATSFGASVAMMAVSTLVTGCIMDAEPVAEADQPFWSGYRIINLQARPGTTYVVEPRYLLDSAEAWGPQTMLLSIDRRVGTILTMQHTPGIQIAKDKLTRTLQQAIGVNFLEDVEITASSSTDVLEGWYERMEAYPTFQAITWELVPDGPFGGSPPIASGTLYRPMGIYFKVVVVVRGPKKPPFDDGQQPGSKDRQRAPNERQPGENERQPGPNDREPGSITAIGRPVLGEEATMPRR